MKIGIVCALAKEQAQLLERLPNPEKIVSGPFTFFVSKLNGNELILTQSGIAKVNAAACAVELINRFSPDVLINSGVAGGLDPKLNPLDVVAGEGYVHHDVFCGPENEWGQVQGLPSVFEGDKKLLACVERLKNERVFSRPVHTGLICTGEQFITDSHKLQAIRENFPAALACDMESAAFAQVCHLYKVPFLSFRVISDVVGKETNNEAQYDNFWETVTQTAFGNTWAFLSALAQEK